MASGDQLHRVRAAQFNPPGVMGQQVARRSRNAEMQSSNGCIAGMDAVWAPIIRAPHVHVSRRRSGVVERSVRRGWKGRGEVLRLCEKAPMGVRLAVTAGRLWRARRVGQAHDREGAVGF